MTPEDYRARTNKRIEMLYAKGQEIFLSATTDAERQLGVDMFRTGLDTAILATANAMIEMKKENKHI